MRASTFTRPPPPPLSTALLHVSHTPSHLAGAQEKAKERNWRRCGDADAGAAPCLVVMRCVGEGSKSVIPKMKSSLGGLLHAQSIRWQRAKLSPASLPDDNAGSNPRQQPTNEAAFIAELVKCLQASTDTEAFKASHEPSVKENQRVDAETLTKCTKQGNVDELELIWTSRDASNVTNSYSSLICCSCEKGYPISNPNIKRKSKSSQLLHVSMSRASHHDATAPRGLALKSHGTLAMRTLWRVPVDIHSTPELCGGGCKRPLDHRTRHDIVNNTTLTLNTDAQVASEVCQKECWLRPLTRISPHHHGPQRMDPESRQ